MFFLLAMESDWNLCKSAPMAGVHTTVWLVDTVGADMVSHMSFWAAEIALTFQYSVNTLENSESTFMMLGIN